MTLVQNKEDEIMEGESTGKGKSGEPGKGGAAVEDEPQMLLSEVEGEGSEDGPVEKAVAQDDGMIVTTPIVLAIGHAVTSSRHGDGDVPSSLAENVLKTRYQAWERMKALEEHSDTLTKCATGSLLPSDESPEKLAITEVAVVNLDGLRMLMRKAGFGKDIGLNAADVGR